MGLECGGNLLSWNDEKRGRIRFPLLLCVSGRLDIKACVLKLGTTAMAIGRV